MSAPAIQDNSFFIEEAYNQEDRVVQHISTFVRLGARRARPCCGTRAGVFAYLSLEHPF